MYVRSCETLLKFQPTRPLRGATPIKAGEDTPKRISTHAPLAGRDGYDGRIGLYVDISTHAPLAGRDRLPVEFRNADYDFNPRAPCGARHSGGRHVQG